MKRFSCISGDLSLSPCNISAFVSQDPAGPGGAVGGILIFQGPVPRIGRIRRCPNLREHLLHVILTVHVRQYAEVVNLSLRECKAREWIVVRQVAILLSFDVMWA